ncbi:hypothetical protein PAAG_02739 [Paracoccidioides lutzii Pb01]|uniref:Uncharacterized protein n=1 Tax=Paracoccidioides lutzii (strain ATCC MYA-826 / Pb01) TaxID=502779 RepID=C1GW44_PARBA|nr:hypothetical protein PAAG_02739 [Paracoccidioides lutzii Pb01]EEH40763.2 hypothetical protein PAAG_02739 [Paracoccidioides lutzii Pb01]
MGKTHRLGFRSLEMIPPPLGEVRLWAPVRSQYGNSTVNPGLFANGGRSVVQEGGHGDTSRTRAVPGGQLVKWEELLLVTISPQRNRRNRGRNMRSQEVFFRLVKGW